MKEELKKKDLQTTILTNTVEKQESEIRSKMISMKEELNKKDLQIDALLNEKKSVMKKLQTTELEVKSFREKENKAHDKIGFRLAETHLKKQDDIKFMLNERFTNIKVAIQILKEKTEKLQKSELNRKQQRDSIDFKSYFKGIIKKEETKKKNNQLNEQAMNSSTGEGDSKPIGIFWDIQNCQVCIEHYCYSRSFVHIANPLFRILF